MKRMYNIKMMQYGELDDQYKAIEYKKLLCVWLS